MCPPAVWSGSLAKSRGPRLSQYHAYSTQAQGALAAATMGLRDAARLSHVSSPKHDVQANLSIRPKSRQNPTYSRPVSPLENNTHPGSLIQTRQSHPLELGLCWDCRSVLRPRDVIGDLPAHHCPDSLIPPHFSRVTMILFLLNVAMARSSG